jgi:hypothetical protein
MLCDGRFVGRQTKGPTGKPVGPSLFRRSRAGGIRQNLDGIGGNGGQRIGTGVRKSLDLLAWAAVVAIFDAGNDAGNKDVSAKGGAGGCGQTGLLLKLTGGRRGRSGGIAASQAASDSEKTNAQKPMTT